ncbi:MAG: hypothetical protein AAFZ74_14165 [Pseudomonadota bacterium]
MSLRFVFAFITSLGLLAACATVPASTAFTPEMQEEILASYDVAPEDRYIQRSCITPDWPVVHGATFTEAVFDARFSYVKRIGRNNGYLIEYARSCERLTRNGRAGIGLPVSCRGDIVRLRGIPCRVHSIYKVENEQDAQKLALVILDQRVRDGDLPEDVFEANLRDQSNALR